MLKIYNFFPNGRGLRVSWLCEEMGLPYSLVPIPCPAPAEYRRLNPLGTVPFLQDSDGVAISESIAMMLYIVKRYGPSALLPEDEPAIFARVLQMTELGEATLGAGLNPLVGARYFAPAADKRSWSVRNLEGRAERVLELVRDTLSSRPFIVGNSFTIADISVSFALGMWCNQLGKQLPPSLTAYYGAMTSRPAYRRALGARPEQSACAVQ